jgi:hypothetical protein
MIINLNSLTRNFPLKRIYIQDKMFREPDQFEDEKDFKKNYQTSTRKIVIKNTLQMVLCKK